MGKMLGYARVSTEEQATDSQAHELQKAGCEVIYREQGSGASRSRPELTRLLREVASGDILVVVRLDRLARSVSHLLEIIETLAARGAHFRSLHDPIDTSTPQGMFSLQVLGAVAQLERALISERTKAGLRTAKTRGRVGGNPGLRTGDPAAIRKIMKARDQTFLSELIGKFDLFMPVVLKLRPASSWDRVVKVLNAQQGTDWTVERLRRAVRRLVSEGLASPDVLQRTPARGGNERLAVLVAGIAMANPAASLRNIAAQLEAMHERTPRGGARWTASSVQNMLQKAEKMGIVSRSA